MGDDGAALALFHAAVSAGGELTLSLEELAARLQLPLLSGDVYVRHVAGRRLGGAGLELIDGEAGRVRLRVLGYEQALAEVTLLPHAEGRPDPSRAPRRERLRAASKVEPTDAASSHGAPDRDLVHERGPAPSALASAARGAPRNLGEIGEKVADKALTTALKGWWSRRTDVQKLATGLIAFAIAIGPAGEGFFAAIGALYNNKIPSTKQVEAVFWLLWIALPIPAFILVGFLAAGRVSGGAALVLAGAACLGAAFVYGGPVPNKLAGLYCYADTRGGKIIYEEKCREFNKLGFVADNAARVGRPTEAGKIFGSALAYTKDARGDVMTFAAVLASLGVGLLIRKDLH